MKLDHLPVSTDFSECGQRAVRRVALLAAQAGARLRIVHALPGAALTWQLMRVSGIEAEASLRTSLRRGVEEQLAELAITLRARHAIEVAYDIGTGAEHRVIGDAVEAHQPDLLVISAHGEGIVQQLFLGGTAGKLLTHSTRPVLVVRLAADAPYRMAVAAVDLGPHTRHVLDSARAVAPQAVCHALHAFVAPFEGQLRMSGAREPALQRYRDEQRQKVHERFAQLVPDAPGVSRMVHDGQATSVLLEWVSQHHADVIVTARHSGMRFSEAVLGSVPRFLAFHAACDVLVV